MARPLFKTVYTFSLLAPTLSWAVNVAAPTQNLARSDALPDLNEPPTEFDLTEQEQRKTEKKVQQNPDFEPEKNTSGSLKTLSVSKTELAQQPELLYRALSSAVLMNNIEGVQTLLPIYQNLPDPKDEVLHDLASAMLAKHHGLSGKAAILYQKVLDSQPNLASAKLGLAQSLFDDKQNKEADQAFANIQAEADLPDNVRELTESYRKIIKKRQKMNFYASANYNRERNVNNAPSIRTVKTRNGEWRLPEPKRAQGFIYRAGMNKDTALFKNYHFRTNVDLWGKFYWDNHAYDDLNARASAGIAYQNARTEVAALPYYERRWFGTEKYATEKGGRVEASHWLNRRNQLILAGELGRDKYDTRSFLNGKVGNISATLMHVHNANQYFTIGMDLARKSAQDSSDSYRRKGIRASWTRHWKRSGFSTVLSANYGQRSYDANDFFNIVRQDKELSATLSVWHKKVQLWGIQPRVVAVYQRHNSNHFLYDYRKAYAFVQLSKSI